MFVSVILGLFVCPSMLSVHSSFDREGGRADLSCCSFIKCKTACHGKAGHRLRMWPSGPVLRECKSAWFHWLQSHPTDQKRITLYAFSFLKFQTGCFSSGNALYNLARSTVTFYPFQEDIQLNNSILLLFSLSPYSAVKRECRQT